MCALHRVPDPALALGAALLLAAGALSGCETPAPSTSKSKQGVSTGLAALSEEAKRPEPPGDDEIERMIAESARRLETYFEEGPKAAARQTPPAAIDDGAPAGGFSGLSAFAEDEPDPPSAPDVTPVRVASATPPPRTTDSEPPSRDQSDPATLALLEGYGFDLTPAKSRSVAGETHVDEIDFLTAMGVARPASRETDPAETARRGELSARLVETLRTLVAQTSDPEEAYRAAAALAGLEAIEPGAIDRIADSTTLTPEELEVIRAAGELARALGQSESPLGADRASQLLDELGQRLAAARGLRITTSTLCTRVNGFGRYEEFGRNVFLAGRSQPVIVYVEVDGFAIEPRADASGASTHEVELSQRLELYHEGDGLNVWNRAAEIDRTVSRNVLRDYYLINQVVLPPTLGVGRYVLKVVMRDLNSPDGAMDETLIPVEIVSDPSMAYPNTMHAASARP